MEENRPMQSEETEQLDLSGRLVGQVSARQVNLANRGAVLISAAEDVSLTSGGAIALIAGRDLSVTAGGGQVLLAGGDMHIQGGGGMFLIGEQVQVDKGVVGFLISGQTTLGEGSRVLLNTPQAIALGAALGAAFAVFRFLLQRRARG